MPITGKPPARLASNQATMLCGVRIASLKISRIAPACRSQAQTDVESFAVLEPLADGFRNYQQQAYTVPAEQMLVERRSY